MKHVLQKINYRDGYVALVSVILVCAIGVAIMVSVIASGVMAGKTDFALQQSGAARSMASSCAEEALQIILETSTTSANGNLTIASTTCAYQITSSSSQTIINATGVVGTITSKIKVIITSTSPSITLSSWQEVGDF